MLFKIKTYIQFLLKSTNQHGVHSPFVYSLVTKCFYDRTRKESYTSIKSILKNDDAGIRFKNAKLVNRLIPYFEYHKILVLGDSANTVSQILKVNTHLSVYTSIPHKEAFDFIYLDIQSNTYNSEMIEQLFSRVTNDSLVLIKGIYASEKSIQLWNRLKRHSHVKVTIDTYDFGFIFFRKEQVKEHFTIRM